MTYTSVIFHLRRIISHYCEKVNVSYLPIASSHTPTSVVAASDLIAHFILYLYAQVTMCRQLLTLQKWDGK